MIVIVTATVSAVYGLIRAWPCSKISRTIAASAHKVTVNVVVGDLLTDKGQIVVGFCDTFDTDTKDDRVISSTSLQGQLLSRRFGGDSKQLDMELASALKGVKAIKTETRSSKQHGKLNRYPVGTVAVLGDKPANKIYALAYSTMNNDLVAESSVHDIWTSLGQLWSAVYNSGQQQPIALPLVGTGLARINFLDRESMLRMTLLSFVARSREKMVCKELTVYIHPSDRDKINMLELEAFIRTL
jgi:hypothetical protein